MSEPKDIINTIKELLGELESDIVESDNAVFKQNFDALEIPDLVASIVDYLQPQLTVSEATFYWYLFGNSILTSVQHKRNDVRCCQVIL